MKKLLITFLLLLSTTFAGWETTAGIAVMTSLMLLIVLYMAGFATQNETLKLMCKDEFYQLIAVALMVAVFFGTNNLIDLISKNATLGGADTLQIAALKSLNNTLSDIKSDFDAINSADKSVGEEASAGTSCSVLGIGYFISACGGFSMLQAPFSLVGSVFGFAIGELTEVIRLIELSQAYALALLLPFGIILRTFKITRGAGGLLIGLAIAMHLLLPMGIMFTEYFGDAFIKYTGGISGVKSDINAPYKSTSKDLTIESCSPGETDSDWGGTGDDSTNEVAAMKTYDNFRAKIKSYMYNILVRATLGPVIAVLMLVSGIRAISALGGAEIDVSALSKVV